MPRPLRLFLVAQYYAALKYAAESVRSGRNRTRRRVYLMPLGGVDGGWVWGAVAATEPWESWSVREIITKWPYFRLVNYYIVYTKFAKLLYICG